MDRDSLAKKYNVKRLEDYVIEEFNAGKNEAETLCNKYFENSISEIEKNDESEFKLFFIISEILKIKKEFSFVNNNFGYIIREAKDYISHNSMTPKTESEEVEMLAKYILDYYDFKKLPSWRSNFQLKRLRENSRRYHLVNNILSQGQIFFKYLNNLQQIENFVWEWNNFEIGVNKTLIKYISDKANYLAKSKHDFDNLKIDKKYELEVLEINKNSEIDEVKYDLKCAKNDVVNLNKKNELILDNQNKYYYNSQIIPNNTFFGDNTPFLFNLFNFLKKNNLYNYGWSYFHSCMEMGNHEMIPLNKPKKSNFIGRIFYHLSSYLILHFKDNPMQFIKAKFLIDETAITDSFKNNHMKPTYDKLNDPELETVDDFFENQKKIYLKS